MASLLAFCTTAAAMSTRAENESDQAGILQGKILFPAAGFGGLAISGNSLHERRPRRAGQ